MKAGAAIYDMRPHSSFRTQIASLILHTIPPYCFETQRKDKRALIQSFTKYSHIDNNIGKLFAFYFQQDKFI